MVHSFSQPIEHEYSFPSDLEIACIWFHETCDAYQLADTPRLLRNKAGHLLGKVISLLLCVGLGIHSHHILCSTWSDEGAPCSRRQCWRSKKQCSTCKIQSDNHQLSDTTCSAMQLAQEIWRGDNLT